MSTIVPPRLPPPTHTYLLKYRSDKYVIAHSDFTEIQYFKNEAFS